MKLIEPMTVRSPGTHRTAGTERGDCVGPSVLWDTAGVVPSWPLVCVLETGPLGPQLSLSSAFFRPYL